MFSWVEWLGGSERRGVKLRDGGERGLETKQILYADDKVLKVESSEDLQRIVNQLEKRVVVITHIN